MFVLMKVQDPFIRLKRQFSPKGGMRPPLPGVSCSTAVTMKFIPRALSLNKEVQLPDSRISAIHKDVSQTVHVNTS